MNGQLKSEILKIVERKKMISLDELISKIKGFNVEEIKSTLLELDKNNELHLITFAVSKSYMKELEEIMTAK